MAQRTECYVDTSALIAFLDRSDSYHALFKRLFSNPPRLATSALVIAEGHGWFLRRYDQIRAVQFLGFIDQLTLLAIQPFDATALSKSARFAKKLADQELTMADAHGLVLIEERRITSCWSTDSRLSRTGIPLLI